MDEDLIIGINQSFELKLPPSISEDELRYHLEIHINYLINHDFEKLIHFLYRVDVDEDKMRLLLEQRKGENAAKLIATLIIERHQQKLKTRKQFNNRNKSIDEEENW